MNSTNSTMMKQVAEVRLGGYRVALDAEKLATLEGLGEPDCPHVNHIQELTDFVMDLCCGIEAPAKEHCVKYLAHLRSLRMLMEQLRQVNVTREKGGEQ